jgi:hypothetical protein
MNDRLGPTAFAMWILVVGGFVIAVYGSISYGMKQDPACMIFGIIVTSVVALLVGIGAVTLYLKHKRGDFD